MVTALDDSVDILLFALNNLQIVSRDQQLSLPRPLAAPGARRIPSRLLGLLGLVWLPFVTSRVAMFLVAWLYNALNAYGRPNDPLVYGPAWRAWLSWDGVHYLRLANVGYPVWTNSPENGYFPLLPLLIHLLGGSAAAALALAAVAGLAGLAVLAGLTREVFDERVAARTAWVAAWWPVGFVWTAVYTEGLFLALAAGSLWAAWRGRVLLAVGLGFLAGTLRATGVGLVLPLLVLLPAGRARLAALAPLAGTACFAAYEWFRTGDALTFLHAQVAGRPQLHPLRPLDLLASTDHGGAWELTVGLPILALVGMLVGVLVLERRWRLPSLAVVAGFLGPALAAGTLYSFGRYAMVSFPLYWALQKATTRWLVVIGVPAALIVTAASGSGRLTP